MRIAIIGNSGSGKSTLARWLAAKSGAPLLDLDTVAWVPGRIAVPRAPADAENEVRSFCSGSKKWVVEGCYANLVNAALAFSPRLLFLNPGEEQCLANCRARPWEPHKYDSKDEQDTHLPFLLSWVGEYSSPRGGDVASRPCLVLRQLRRAEVRTPHPAGADAAIARSVDVDRLTPGATILRGSKMARSPFIGALVVSLIALHIVAIDNLRAQVPATAGHEHLTGVACVDVPPGEKRPEFGCFNIGAVTGLHFSQASVYWHLLAFPSREAAETAKTATAIVVEEDGRVWLSEFGPRNTAPQGGEPIALVGPLQLPAAKSYSAVLSYAVMRPGDSSRVHTHPGPEGWYVLAGEQCLETPAGADRTRAGGTMTVRPNIPMELHVTGTTVRRAFALVIHDSAQERGIPSAWKPSGACSR